MATNLRRVYRNFMRRNNINIEYVQVKFVRRLYKTTPGGRRLLASFTDDYDTNSRRLLSEALYDEIDYTASMNTTEAVNDEEAENMVLEFIEAVNNPDVEQLAEDLNNDPEWTNNGDEDPIVAADVITEDVDTDTLLVEMDTFYDPNDPKWCQWTVDI